MQSDSGTSPIIAAYAFAIATALEQQGVDAAAVFERCEIALPTTTDPMLRLSNLEVSRLFAESVRVTGDPCFGLVVAEAFHPGNLHAMGYAMMSSTSLRDFCERLCRYYRVVSSNALISIEEEAGAFNLVTHTQAADICWETQDAFIGLMVRFIRFIFTTGFRPARLELIRPHPGDPHNARFLEYFDCSISYGHPRMCVALDPATVDVALPGASKELAQMHDETVMHYLQQLDKEDVVTRVQTIVVEELSSGALNKQRVADKLHMSARTLQMKLAARDTSFQELLDTTRHKLALGYMEQTAISITEAAYLLGFSEVSNFTRAFRRWTGKSPRDYRQSLGLD